MPKASRSTKPMVSSTCVALPKWTSGKSRVLSLKLVPKAPARLRLVIGTECRRRTRGRRNDFARPACLEAYDTKPSSRGISLLNPLVDEGMKGGEGKASENGRGDEAAGHHHGQRSLDLGAVQAKKECRQKPQDGCRCGHDLRTDTPIAPRSCHSRCHSLQPSRIHISLAFCQPDGFPLLSGW